MFTSVYTIEQNEQSVQIEVQFGTREQTLCEYEDCGEFHDDWQALLISYDFPDFWQAGQFLCQISARLDRCDWAAIHETQNGFRFPQLFEAVCDAELAEFLAI
jgi:hypothetical protein